MVVYYLVSSSQKDDFDYVTYFHVSKKHARVLAAVERAIDCALPMPDAALSWGLEKRRELNKSVNFCRENSKSHV